MGLLNHCQSSASSRRSDRIELERQLDKAWEAITGSSETSVATRLTPQTMNLGQARTETDIALLLDGENPRAVLYDAIVTFAEGQSDRAVAKLKDLIAEHPDFGPAHNYLGLIYLDQGKFTEALPIFERGSKAAPDDYILLTNLGNLLLKVGQPYESEATLNKAIQINSSFALAHASLGNALAASGRMDSALNAYRRATGLASGNAAIYRNYGSLLNLTGDLDGAERVLRQTVRLDPADSVAWLILSEVLRQSGDTAGARVAREHSDQLKTGIPIPDVLQLGGRDDNSKPSPPGP